VLAIARILGVCPVVLQRVLKPHKVGPNGLLDLGERVLDMAARRAALRGARFAFGDLECLSESLERSAGQRERIGYSGLAAHVPSLGKKGSPEKGLVTRSGESELKAGIKFLV
jgi:hypothetical protein